MSAEQLTLGETDSWADIEGGYRSRTDLDNALAVRDLITPEQFDLLYGPWASVMEPNE